ncbi:MAG: hypothetical protein ACREUN_10270 [Burkholderiales bacterium]
MKKPVNFASVLFIAAALGLWAWQQAPAADRLASLSATEAAVR